MFKLPDCSAPVFHLLTLEPGMCLSPPLGWPLQLYHPLPGVMFPGRLLAPPPGPTMEIVMCA